jgi:pimeloyl-ACP methyl ester carboxylesterase
VRISAPATGTDLPVIVFAHGYGWSMNAYAPLVDHWASHGFVVLQPTFLDSRTLALAPDDPRTPGIWRTRVADMVRVLDELPALGAAVPGLAGRLDHSRIAAVGHSYGAQTVGMLLGARVLGADGAPGESLADPRITTGVLLAATGDGDSLTPFAAEHFGFMRPDFSTMTAPALVVAGDRDDSPPSTRGPDWFTDAYHRSPESKTLLNITGGEHSLGGISGYDVAETTDADPDRVDLVGTAVLRWLEDALLGRSTAWSDFEQDLVADGPRRGRLEHR